MKLLRMLFRCIAALAVLLMGCKENPVTPVSNREIRLRVNSTGLRVTWEDWVDQSFYDRLFNFDLRNYPAADSIVFAFRFASLDTGTTVYTRLFNVTDSVAIAGSEMHSNSTDWKLFVTPNLRGALPNHPIDLAMQAKKKGTSYGDTAGEGSYLILYSK